MPISCNLYDTIEIVCMFHYPITLTLRDKTKISGIALDTKRNDERLECVYPCYLEMLDFSKSKSVPNARHKMCR